MAEKLKDKLLPKLWLSGYQKNKILVKIYTPVSTFLGKYSKINIRATVM